MDQPKIHSHLDNGLDGKAPRDVSLMKFEFLLCGAGILLTRYFRPSLVECSLQVSAICDFCVKSAQVCIGLYWKLQPL